MTRTIIPCLRVIWTSLVVPFILSKFLAIRIAAVAEAHSSSSSANACSQFGTERLVVMAAGDIPSSLGDHPWRTQVIRGCVLSAVGIHGGRLNGGQKPADTVDIFLQ